MVYLPSMLEGECIPEGEGQANGMFAVACYFIWDGTSNSGKVRGGRRVVRRMGLVRATFWNPRESSWGFHSTGLVVSDERRYYTQEALDDYACRRQSLHVHRGNSHP